MKKVLFLIPLLLLVSCTSIDDVMKSWIGKHKSELLKSWGPPQQTSDDGKGGDILNYIRYSNWNRSVEVKRQFYADPQGIIYYYRWEGH